MVDINLFKDEDEEEKWESDSGGDEKSDAGDDLIDDFPIEEELTESSALSDNDLLDSDEPIPDFEEPEENALEEDYQFGDIKEKKTSPWIWVALGVVLIFAAVYFFYIQPRQTPPEQVVPRMPSGLSEGGVSSEGASDSGEGVVDSGSEEGVVSEESGAASETEVQSQIGGLNALASVSAVVDASVAVFSNLTQTGQLGTIVLEGYQFHVGYVSETPGVAQAMGARIQSILGISEFNVSPEDPHRTAGRMHYWGVISGVIPQKASTSSSSAESRQFATTDQFIQEINTLIQNNRLSVEETQKFSARSEGGLNQVPIRMKIEGNKAQTLGFLNSLKGLQGNYRLLKLTMAPVDISDFQASQVKLVLEFGLFIA